MSDYPTLHLDTN